VNKENKNKQKTK